MMLKVLERLHKHLRIQDCIYVFEKAFFFSRNCVRLSLTKQQCNSSGIMVHFMPDSTFRTNGYQVMFILLNI